MLGRLKNKILPLLQFTRFALVFTAIADALCTLILQAHFSTVSPLTFTRVLAVAGISVGLYGFGMTLNDIIDRRRDELLASHRPLPSRRIGLTTAHAVSLSLAGLAIVCGAFFAQLQGSWLGFYLVLCTLGLILFYDIAGKYLVAPGLIALGLIRFLHAAIPAPHLPVVWHPLLLLNHVAILSTIAYALEDKRPPLNRRHIKLVGGTLVVIDLLVVGVMGYRRTDEFTGFAQALYLHSGLALPLAAVAAFAALATWIIRTHPNRKEAGQQLMLYGLLWLIVYDAAFVAGYVGLLPALAVLALLPVAYLSVKLIRAWSQIAAAARRPDFIRHEVT